MKFGNNNMILFGDFNNNRFNAYKIQDYTNFKNYRQSLKIPIQLIKSK
jgi:hypothetical protein